MGKHKDEMFACAAGLKLKKTPATSGGTTGTADLDSKEDLRFLLTRKRVLFGQQSRREVRHSLL